MDVVIRPERKTDASAINAIIKEAFANDEYSDHREHILVEKLRFSKDFIPELSLIAEYNNSIVGYIILSKISIVNSNNSFKALALAPVAVKPTFQNQHIGTKLVLEAHKKALELSYERIVVLGHASYYPRFGYVPLHKHNIEYPFDAPKENCMIIGLKESSLINIEGSVCYPKEFFD